MDRDWFWDSRLKQLTPQAPETADASWSRSEDVVFGYAWKSAEGFRVPAPLIQDLSSFVNTETLELDTGAECHVFKPRAAKTWLLSLHGGPESREDREIRYGGLYRDLLRSGVGVIVLNYVGSTGNSSGSQRKAWGRWRLSIIEDFECLLEKTRSFGITPGNLSVLGVSFGGSLALLLHERFEFRRVILSSPLLDLRRQMKRAGGEFESWFSSRFGSADFEDFQMSRLTNISGGEIHCFYGTNDEVLGTDNFDSLERSSSTLENWAIYRDQCTHAPATYGEVKTRFSRVRDVIVSDPHSSR